MRAARLIKRPPRAWRRMEDSIEHNWMVDQAWLIERVNTAGTHGTPGFETREFGPFAAKVLEAKFQERHDPDREVIEGAYTLAIMSDRPPKERQGVRIVSDTPAKTGTYRIEATVNPRPAAWGQVPVYNVEIVRTDEY